MLVLSCGAEDPLGDIYPDDRVLEPQMLPVPLESPPPPTKKRKRSTGCDTILHYGAIVSQEHMWRAAEMPGHRFVIPLEDQYFSPEAMDTLRLGREACGCVRLGMGCAVCGNALGSLYEPCRLHQTSKSDKNYYTFLPSAVSPPIPPPPPITRWVPPLPHALPVPRAPAPPPRYITRRRHPTSPPPVIFADITPTPSPEMLPASLPPDDTAATEEQEQEQEQEQERAVHVWEMWHARLSELRRD